MLLFVPNFSIVRNRCYCCCCCCCLFVCPYKSSWLYVIDVVEDVCASSFCIRSRDHFFLYCVWFAFAVWWFYVDTITDSCNELAMFLLICTLVVCFTSQTTIGVEWEWVRIHFWEIDDDTGLILMMLLVQIFLIVSIVVVDVCTNLLDCTNSCYCWRRPLPPCISGIGTISSDGLFFVILHCYFFLFLLFSFDCLFSFTISLSNWSIHNW